MKQKISDYKIFKYLINIPLYSLNLRLAKIPKRTDIHKANKVSYCFVKAKKKDAVLLDEYKRIPFFKSFHSVWYANRNDFVANQHAQGIARSIIKTNRYLFFQRFLAICQILMEQKKELHNVACT